MVCDLDWLSLADDAVRQKLVDALDQAERNEFAYHWRLQAREAQLPPPGAWRTWLVLAGRGFGKTRAGAEWVRMVAESDGAARIALVSSSLAEARSVMVEGESGLLACSPPDRRPSFEASLRRLRYPNGAEVRLYSAAEPESLRGPQHSHAWCDELGKWRNANDRAIRAWDNLLKGLRLGVEPRVVITTTPRTGPLLQRVIDAENDEDMVITRGSTFDNAANLPDRFLRAMDREFGGSQLGRQEIDGEYLREMDGALWTRAMIDEVRASPERGDWRRVVVAIDPPASAQGDECGIIVAAIGFDGIAYVLADCTVTKPTPERWAQAAADAAMAWEADRVVAEANQGGAMVEAVLRAADHTLPIKLVHASRGKVARAEPIAALYGAGRVRHCGNFARLEDQLCGLLMGGDYAGPGRSPDRADALVWALSELMLSRSRNPSVRSL
ncbi:DNA-packaging protein [Qipengyuania nanhaisediminis]|uniref:DNA-packaging protein n=1 Tax=Qipengyuania nanhaisediminis TaxID=604088 RepID=UPI0038B2DEFD